jgi:hypothetical protein
MKKLDLENYISLPIEKPSWDSASLNELMSRHFYLQMMDVWGEADRLVRYHSTSCIDTIDNQVKNFHNICSTIHYNENIEEGVKWELKIAQWELLDFCIWDNVFYNDSNSVMKWFDQWQYDINYDLIS